MLVRERKEWTAWFDEVVDLEGDGTWAARGCGELKLAVDAARVQVRGSVTADIPRECDCCLAHFLHTVGAKVAEVCLMGEAESGDAAWDEDNEVWRVGLGGRVDVTEMVRQAILLALPTRGVCGDDCPRARELDTTQHEAQVDPRWAGLTQLQRMGEDDGRPEA
ncbi:MAG: DUF177 domain-containing protein [Armatimonadetes bacterium]|nr:DUF177 domain-containing protein [Armatimonadota bacterium]